MDLTPTPVANFTVKSPIFFAHEQSMRRMVEKHKQLRKVVESIKQKK